MTFILGMKCTDGLVMCADTLETDGVTRTYRNKLPSMEVGNDWGICWGASGTAYTCDKFADKLKGILAGKPYNRASIETDVETCLEFIKQSYTKEHSIAVVVGCFGHPSIMENGKRLSGPCEYHLYRGSSETACLSPIKDYCCAGMDVTLASFMLSNTYHSFMPVAHGTRLGVFVTCLMKRHAEGVGGDITCKEHIIGTGRWDVLLDSETRDIEKMFPLEILDETVSRFWLEFQANQNLDELTQADLNKRRAQRS